MPRKKKTTTAAKPSGKKVYKKRGRKPKGGKIVSSKIVLCQPKQTGTPNIILHLKCSTNDLLEKHQTTCGINPTETFSNLSYKQLYKVTKKKPVQENKKEAPNQQIWDKLKNLSYQLHNNDVYDKKSNCFWCTCSFDNPPIYIPRQEKNNVLETYGCFCSPECACAFLNKENLDSSAYWERYALLNNIYGKIYDYKIGIKPAPSPFYTLEKYYGNLSIQEYRKLLKNDRILMVVEKPLTKILPEIHDEKNEHPQIHNNLLNGKYGNGNYYRLKRKDTQFRKNDILHNTFNLK